MLPDRDNWAFKSKQENRLIKEIEMPLITLHQGSDWEMPASSRIVDRFHVIARRNGSTAIWFPRMALLMTDDASEPAKNFPYDDWRVSAAKAPNQDALK